MKVNYFEQAVTRFKEAMRSPDSNEFKIDVCLKRFEFTYEMCKKTLKIELADLDVKANNPREVIKKAAQQGLVSDVGLWDQMREDRNDTAHEYDEKKHWKYMNALVLTKMNLILY